MSAAGHFRNREYCVEQLDLDPCVCVLPTELSSSERNYVCVVSQSLERHSSVVSGGMAPLWRWHVQIEMALFAPQPRRDIGKASLLPRLRRLFCRSLFLQVDLLSDRSSPQLNGCSRHGVSCPEKNLCDEQML